MDSTGAPAAHTTRRPPIVRRPPFGTNPLVGERGSDTQRRILTAALDVFAEVGYYDTRVELITERAGCSRPAFYQYFSSKDDVFWALAAELGHEMVDLGRQLGPVAPDATGVAALGDWIDEFLTLYETFAPVFSAFQAASRDHEPMAKGAGGISDRLGEALLQACDAHRRHVDGEGLATALVAVLIRCCFYWVSVPTTVERDRLIGGLAQLIHRLFFGRIEGANTVSTPNGSARRPPLVAVPQPPSATRSRALHPRGEKTRQRLLDAGAVVLPARGYHDARVDDIVEVAGVSHGSFYRYFENKDDLFRVLADEASGELITLLDSFPASPDPDSEALRAWFDQWFTTYERNGGVISAWQELQSEAEDADIISFSQQVAASVVTRLIRMLGRRPFGDPMVDALAMLALIERVPYGVLTLRFSDRADAIDAMVTVVRRGFFGVP